MDLIDRLNERVAVIGVGRTGALTAVGLSHLGHDVVGMDLAASRITALGRGYLAEDEPGLRSALAAAIRFRHLHFASSLEPGGFSTAFVCVDTPPLPSGDADLSQVYAAAEAAAIALGPRGILVTRSTVPVGTGDRLICVLERLGRPDIQIVHVPEFLREGHAWEDFLRSDRIIIGGESAETIERIRILFEKLKRPMITTDRRTAELIKYAANAFLAMSISFANEMSELAGTLGIDPAAVFSALRADQRIGPGAYLTPGLGFGGHCLPKDTIALERLASSHGHTMHQLRATLRVNQSRPYDVAAWLRTALGGLRGKRVCIAGLAFKPQTDDLRQSPALYLAMVLQEDGVRVTGWDPSIQESLELIQTYDSLETAVEGADALVISHALRAGQELDSVYLRRRMHLPVIYDAAGALDPAEWVRAGFLVNISVQPSLADLADARRPA